MPGDERTQRLVVLTVWQLLAALAALVAAVALLVWGAAMAYRDVLEQQRLGFDELNKQLEKLDRKFSEKLNDQTRTIEGVVKVVNDLDGWRNDEMDRRSDEAARQRQRKDWCKTGAAKGQACMNLLSDGEIQALEGR